MAHTMPQARALARILRGTAHARPVAQGTLSSHASAPNARLRTQRTPPHPTHASAPNARLRTQRTPPHREGTCKWCPCATDECVVAADGRVEVLVDGGVRRGKDVFRALALGASAVLIGRPTAYGLAAGGEAGVDRVLELLKEELLTVMQLCGCARVGDISEAHVRKSSLPDRSARFGAGGSEDE